MLAKVAHRFLIAFIEKASDTSSILPFEVPSCTHKDMGLTAFNILDARCLFEENVNG